MVDLVPVDHQPEFGEADQAAMMPETFANPAVKSAIEHIAGGVKRLAETPGAVSKPNPYPPGSEEANWYENQRQGTMEKWSPEMAMTMLGGGAGGVEGAAGEAALGSGAARMRMVDQADLYKELANQARTKGYATGKSAEGWDFSRPGPEKGSLAENVAKMRSQLDASTQEALIDIERNRPTPNNPYMSPDDWKFIDENIRKGNPTLGSGFTDKRGAAAMLGLREGVNVDPTQTGWIFKDVAPVNRQMQKGDWRKVTNATETGDGIQNVELPIRSLNASQKSVNPDFEEALARNPSDLPFVIKKNGQYFVQDGHHRITAQAMQGRQTAPVRLVDLDGTTQTSFPMLDYISGGKTLGSGATDEKTAALIQAIRAYHGSPHDFDKFDISKIGSGEGAQAYGHGLYFAENPGVAQSYKAAGQPSYLGADRIKAAQDVLAEAGGDINKARDLADQRMRGTTKYGEGKLWQDVVNNLPDLVGKSPGRMYEVNINADPEHFLDWDKPLSEQSQSVRDALQLGQLPQKPTPAETMAVFQKAKEMGVPANSLPEYKALEARMDSANSDAWAAMGINPSNVHMRPEDMIGAQLYQAFEQGKLAPHQLTDARSPAVAQRLRDAGIPGIKYADQGSRGTKYWVARHPQGGTNEFPSEAEAQAFIKRNPEYSLEKPNISRNYVVFDDKLIDILRKYGIAGLPAGGIAAGAMQQQPSPADMVSAIRGTGG